MTTPTLLCIDDTEGDSELLRVMLEEHGINVDTARTGREGVIMYDPRRHDAVVIDWNLTDAEGGEIARMLRMRWPGCPIAFLSGMYKRENIAAASALGIRHCFEKRMGMEHINQIVNFVRDFTRPPVKRAV